MPLIWYASNIFGKKGHLILADAVSGADVRRKTPGGRGVINQAKQECKTLNARKNCAGVAERAPGGLKPSTSLPGCRRKRALHPVTRTIDCIETFFGELGFSVATARRLKTITIIFDALNIPGHHFGRAPTTILGSTPRACCAPRLPGVIRTMKNQQPPIRTHCATRLS